LSRRAKIALVIGAALLVAVTAAASIIALVGHRSSAAHPVTYAPQVALPFTSLEIPTGVAADGAGNTYVTDYFTHQVWKLAAGATVPTPMPFTGLTNPNGVTVDSKGSLYITDEGNNRVLKLAAGESNPTVLPFTGSKDPDSVAVDADGNVYVTDYHDPCAASKPRASRPRAAGC
jgi:serine/threonine-protein kinase